MNEQILDWYMFMKNREMEDTKKFRLFEAHAMDAYFVFQVLIYLF